MKNPNETLFSHCPACGGKSLHPRNEKAFECKACCFRFYMNCASAVIGLITNDQGELLITRRKHDPAAGTLDLPGGFIEPGETAEAGLLREIKEELNLTVTETRYLTSAPNTYVFKGVEYSVTDLAFICKVADLAPIQANDDVTDFCFMAPKAIDPSAFGLASPKQVFRVYQDHLGFPR